MVDDQLASRDITDKLVLNAMRTVPRHLFIPEKYRPHAYHDGPVQIGQGQTISQPYVVASMTQHLDVNEKSRVLEIGTGSGYQAAVLSLIVKTVYTVEYLPHLTDNARRVFKKLKYRNIKTHSGDGTFGWKEFAPYDAVIVTAAAPKIPDELVKQLKPGGRLVLPVASGSYGHQELVKIVKAKSGLQKEVLYDVRFVPMIGEVEE